MRMVLAKACSKGGYGFELAISYNQVRLSVEVLGHQANHKTFDLQFVLPTRCVGVKVVQKLWVTNQWLAQLRSVP